MSPINDDFQHVVESNFLFLLFSHGCMKTPVSSATIWTGNRVNQPLRSISPRDRQGEHSVRKWPHNRRFFTRNRHSPRADRDVSGRVVKGDRNRRIRGNIARISPPRG